MSRTDDRKYEKIERRAETSRLWRRLLWGVSLAAFLSPSFADFDGLGRSFVAFADTKIAKTIDQDTSLPFIEPEVSSVVFEGPYALTLVNGQTLNVAFTAKKLDESAKRPSVVFGQDKSTTKQTWTLVNSSPAWIGVFNVQNGNTLEVKSTGSNPLGKYSTTNEGDFSLVSLNAGATLRLSAVLQNDDVPFENEVKMGGLLTGVEERSGDVVTIDVETKQTLTVENGAALNGTVVKKGEGTLQILVNKYLNWDKYVSDAAGIRQETIATSASSNFNASESVTTPVIIDSLTVQSGVFRVAQGTGLIQDSNLSINSISLNADTTLDVEYAGTIKLTGGESTLVFSADDGSIVNLYVDKNGYTSYVSEDFNAHMKVGAVTLVVDSEPHQQNVAQEMTVFAATNQGTVDYDASKIKVVDNLLGRYYVLDSEKSNDSKIVLTQKEEEKFGDLGKTSNERSAGASIDSAVSGGNYSQAQFDLLSKLDENRERLDFSSMTGELHASTVGFMYMNNLTTTQTLFEHMRNKQLVAYSGGSAVAPMNYGSGAGTSSQQNNGAYYGGASGGAFDQGPLYYNADANSYAPGVVPIYNSPDVGSYQTGYPSDSGYMGGGYTGGVYNGETYSEGGYEYGNGAYVPTGGSYDLGWNGAKQRSTLATLRGQEAEYGDPGTLIYSAWATSLGGSLEAKLHKDALAYKGTQAGILGGLDLFGSCDCRFGVFYGYQKNDLKDKDEDSLKSLGLGKLSTKDHLIGLYHQYGDETVYNIAMIRAGYDQYATERVSSVLGSNAVFTSKYNGYNAGASFERGANFAAEPFVFSPYASLDYNFFYREKFREDFAAGSEAFANNFGLIAKKSMYHSLRGQLGGRIALDLYPASMQLRFVVRAAYVHEFLNAMYGKTEMCYASLQDCSSCFNVYGNSMGRDWAVAGLGIDWAPVPCLVLAAKSDCLWNKYAADAYGSLGLKFRW